MILAHICIVVRNGIVESVHADTDEVEVEVRDYDVQDEQDEPDPVDPKEYPVVVYGS